MGGLNINPYCLHASRGIVPVIIRNQQSIISYIQRVINQFKETIKEAVLSEWQKSASNLYKNYIKSHINGLKILKNILTEYQRGLSIIKNELSKDEAIVIIAGRPNVLFATSNELYTDSDVGLPFILKYLHNIKLVYEN